MIKAEQKLGQMHITGLSGRERDRYLKRYRLPNPEYVQAARDGRYTNAPKWKYFAHEKKDTLIVPVLCYKKWRPEQPAQIIIGDRSPELRDYQDKALQKWEALNYGILQAGAGSGKTVVGSALIQRKGVRSVVIVPSADILHQWYDTLKYLFGEEAGRVGDGHSEEGRNIVLSTYQSAIKRPDMLRTADLILVDESHRTPCSSIETILAATPAAYRYGCTATPWRSDGLHESLKWLLGGVSVRISKEEIGEHLLKPKIWKIDTKFEFCFSKPKGGRGPSAHVLFQNAVALHDDRNLQVASLLRMTLKDGHTTLVLGNRLDQLIALSKTLPAKVPWGLIHGGTKKKTRRDVLEHMTDGRGQVLFATYQLAGEGLNIPRLSALVMAAPTGNPKTTEQSVGRICRPFAGKPAPVVYDVVDCGPNARRAWSARLQTYRNLEYEVL